MADIDLSEMFVHGLRPHATMPRNAMFVEDLKNLQCSEKLAKPLQTLTYPGGFQEDVGTWPHFQVHRAENIAFVTAADAIYPVNIGNLTTGSAVPVFKAVDTDESYTISGGGPWRMTAFQHMGLFTNGENIVMKLPHAADVKVTGVEAATLAAAFIGNWGNRLVLGGLTGSALASDAFQDLYNVWVNSEHKRVVTSIADEFDTSWCIVGPDLGGDNTVPLAAMFAWLGLPCQAGPEDPYDLYYDKFEQDMRYWAENGYLHFIPCRQVGPLRGGMQHGTDFLVYGRDGVLRLTAAENRIHDTVSLDVGLVGRGALNGDDAEHAMVATTGEVYLLGRQANRYAWAEPVGDDGWFRLGYQEYVGSLAQNDNLLVAFDPSERYYWFADAANCYGLSRTGLYQSLAVRPTSVVRLPGQTGGAIAAFKVDDDQGVSFLTHLGDGGRSERWIIQRIDIRTTDTATTPADRWKLGLHARLDKSAAMKTDFAMVAADKRGRVNPTLSVLDYQVKGEAADRTKVDIDRLAIHIGAGNPSMAPWL